MPIGAKKERFRKKSGLRDVPIAQSHSAGWCSSGAVAGQNCSLNLAQMLGTPPDTQTRDRPDQSGSGG